MSTTCILTNPNEPGTKRERERRTTSLCRLKKQCCNAPLKMLQNCHRRCTLLSAAREEKRLPHNTTPQDYPSRFVSSLKFRPFPKCGPKGNNLTLTNPPNTHTHTHKMPPPEPPRHKKILLYTTLQQKQIYLVYTPPPTRVNLITPSTSSSSDAQHLFLLLHLIKNLTKSQSAHLLHIILHLKT